MSDTLSLISKPIEKDMKQFQGLFSELLSHNDGLLHDVLQHIMKRGGKRMRPMLTLLIARALYTQLANTKADIKIAEFSQDAEIYDVLTADQKAELKKLCDAAHQKRKNKPKHK